MICGPRQGSIAAPRGANVPSVRSSRLPSFGQADRQPCLLRRSAQVTSTLPPAGPVAMQEPLPPFGMGTCSLEYRWAFLYVPAQSTRAQMKDGDDHGGYLAAVCEL
jgi:hypothetical protein